jgi:hypothetical protein
LPTGSSVNLEFEPIRLGKNIELRYIPFSELAVPWNVCLDNPTSKQENDELRHARDSSFAQIQTNGAKASRKIRKEDIDALKRSIAQFGLLKPFEVAEMQERLDFFYGKGKYLVIDGQRRYFAIRDLLKLPTEDDERKQRDSLRTNGDNDNVLNLETQAQEQFDRLSVRDYVLIPCLVYPYTTLLQMVRHSIEDKRFSERPSKENFELVERMSAQGIIDLHSDDLRELLKTRSRIEEEKHSIERTLQEIRNRVKQKEMREETETMVENELLVGAEAE